MSWLPEEYKLPESAGNYMSLKSGENRVRILDSAIVGYEYWIFNSEYVKGKPVRTRTMEEASLAKDYETVRPDGRNNEIKHFWAMPVWNYADSAIQVLEFTQKTIMKAIAVYAKDEDWGSPVGYDLVINKSGEGLETEYETIAKPHKAVDESIANKWKELQEAGFDINRLFDGEHPHPSKDGGNTNSGDKDSATGISNGDLTMPESDIDEIMKDLQ